MAPLILIRPTSPPCRAVAAPPVNAVIRMSARCLIASLICRTVPESASCAKPFRACFSVYECGAGAVRFRMALVRILVDGYSLLHNWPELAPGRARHSAAARDELIRRLTLYQAAVGTPVTIFFDGASVPNGQ